MKNLKNFQVTIEINEDSELWKLVEKYFADRHIKLTKKKVEKVFQTILLEAMEKHKRER